MADVEHRQAHRQERSHVHAANRSNLRRVMVALVLTGAFMIVEVVGGILSGSLALLADKDPVPFPDETSEVSRGLIEPHFSPMDRDQHSQDVEINVNP